MEKRRNEWVIHIWGKKRDTLELTEVEKFHIDMLDMFKEQQKKFDLILINIAMDDLNDKKLFNFLKSKVKKVIVNNNVKIKCCQNDIKLAEYVTFRPYVFNRIGEDVNIFYSHFKGYASNVLCNRESFPMRIISICEFYWSYMMYVNSMNFDDVQDKLNNGKSVYCWFIIKCELENLDKKYDQYYIDYQNTLQSGNSDFKKYIEGTYAKHCPGSFVWYNMKSIGESLKDKSLISTITTDYLMDNSIDTVTLCTHFCELYLMQFLKDDECYSVNDFNEDWSKLKTGLYYNLYPSKKIGKEYLDDFEKYLIEKELI